LWNARRFIKNNNSLNILSFKKYLFSLEFLSIIYSFFLFSIYSLLYVMLVLFFDDAIFIFELLTIFLFKRVAGRLHTWCTSLLQGALFYRLPPLSSFSYYDIINNYLILLFFLIDTPLKQ
jgi:hypothetical protein